MEGGLAEGEVPCAEIIKILELGTNGCSRLSALPESLLPVIEGAIGYATSLSIFSN